MDHLLLEWIVSGLAIIFYIFMFWAVFKVADVFVMMRQSSIAKELLENKYKSMQKESRESRRLKDKEEVQNRYHEREEKLKDKARLFREISEMCQ